VVYLIYHSCFNAYSYSQSRLLSYLASLIHSDRGILNCDLYKVWISSMVFVLLFCTNIILAAFLWFHEQRKSCQNDVRMKNLCVKCWWNWRKVYCINKGVSHKLDHSFWIGVKIMWQQFIIPNDKTGVEGSPSKSFNVTSFIDKPSSWSLWNISTSFKWRCWICSKIL